MNGASHPAEGEEAAPAGSQADSKASTELGFKFVKNEQQVPSQEMNGALLRTERLCQLAAMLIPRQALARASLE